MNKYDTVNKLICNLQGLKIEITFSINSWFLFPSSLYKPFTWQVYISHVSKSMTQFKLAFKLQFYSKRKKKKPHDVSSSRSLHSL